MDATDLPDEPLPGPLPEPDSDPGLERELERDGVWLRRTARALTSDPGIAEDAAQAAWIQAWRRRTSNVGEVSRGWLKQVLRNSVRGQVRDDARRSVRERAAAVPEDVDYGDPLHRIELRRITLDAIESLEEPYRSTIVDRFLDGLSIGEIARRSGTSRKTVETRSRRGVLRLKEALQDRRDSRGLAVLTLLGEVARRPELALTAVGSSAASQGLSFTAISAWVVALVAAGALIWHGAGSPADSTEPMTVARVEDSSVREQAEPRAQLAQGSRVAVPLEVIEPDVPPKKSLAAAFAEVIDLDGEPVGGVEVALMKPDGSALPAPSGVRTDASGRATLPAPAAGEEVQLVSVAGSERLSAILCPRLLGGRLARVVVAEQMSGDVRIVNSEGEPIAGAVVLAGIDRDLLERFGTGDGFENVPRWSVVTGAVGDALMSGFPRHRAIEIELSAPGYVAATFSSQDVPSVVELRRASDAGVIGRVLDPFGAPVAGAWVGAGQVLVPTGDDGRFSIVHGARSPEIRATAEGYQPVRIKRVQSSGFIELQLKKRAETLPLVLDEPRGGEVLAVLGGEEPFGLASFEFGASTFSALVSAEGLAAGQGSKKAAPVVLGNGVARATIEGLASRPYQLSLVSIERAEIVATLEVVPNSTDLHVSGAGVGTVTSIAGVVLSYENLPVRGAEVRIGPLGLELPKQRLRRGLTDESGEFRFDGLGGDSWTLLVSAEPGGEVLATRRVESSSNAAPLKIVLPSRRRARLHFSDRLFSTARLTLLDRGGDFVPMITRLGQSTVSCQSLTLGDGQTGVLEFSSEAVWALLETRESSVRKPLPALGDGNEDGVEVLLLD